MADGVTELKGEVGENLFTQGITGVEHGGIGQFCCGTPYHAYVAAHLLVDAGVEQVAVGQYIVPGEGGVTVRGQAVCYAHAADLVIALIQTELDESFFIAGGGRGNGRCHGGGGGRCKGIRVAETGHGVLIRYVFVCYGTIRYHRGHLCAQGRQGKAANQEEALFHTRLFYLA